MPNFNFEKEFLQQIDYLPQDFAKVAATDEVGRGCLAGPVVACAIILKPNVPELLLTKIDDSKKLSKKSRQAISKELQVFSYYSICSIESKIIDEINILQASLLAMKTAFANLCADLHSHKMMLPSILMIDGRDKINDLSPNIKQHHVIKGDSHSITIASASILAKVYRDNLMVDIHKEYPQYDFINNVGYGTKKHVAALEQHGVLNCHRRSFAPIKSLH